MKTSTGFAPLGIFIGIVLAILAVVLFTSANGIPALIVAGVGVSAWSLYYLMQYIAVLVHASHNSNDEAGVEISKSWTGPPTIGLIAVDGSMPRWMSVVRGLAIVCLVVFWVCVLILAGINWSGNSN